MKKNRIAKIYMAFAFTFLFVLIPFNLLKVQAEENTVTVYGTVLAETTAEVLHLSTKEGDMEIKLDTGTDTSACKILLPDKKIYVSVNHGSDGYNHAVKITSDAQTMSTTLDTSTTATVTGTIGEKTRDDIIYFNTDQGEMQIKLDSTTSLSGCSVLIMGKKYNITCVRGSDAYMHAISITDSSIAAAAPGSSAAAITPSPSSPTAAGNAATATVTGTVAVNTKEGLLYLSTKGGEMQLVIDSNTDTRNGMALTPGNKLTVSCYRGSDAYMHAAVIVGVKSSSSSVEIDTSATTTVSGTVGSDTTENVLYLDTKQGEMQIKLDAVSSISSCKAFVSGKKLTVTCARGSDAYMHAISITGDNV